MKAKILNILNETIKDNKKVIDYLKKHYPIGSNIKIKYWKDFDGWEYRNISFKIIAISFRPITVITISNIRGEMKLDAFSRMSRVSPMRSVDLFEKIFKKFHYCGYNHIYLQEKIKDNNYECIDLVY